MVWKLFPFTGDFREKITCDCLGKSQKLRGTKSGLQWGRVTWVIQCFAKKLYMWRNAWAGALLWWSWQSLVAHSRSLLNHPNSFHGGMFKFNAKLEADSLLYSLSHFECNGHTVHMLTQWCLQSPLTSTVKSSLLTHVHSSLLSLLCQCCANHSHYINIVWTFSKPTLYYHLLFFSPGEPQV